MSARRAAAVGGWRETWKRLSAAERSTLSGAELDDLADAAFWVDRPAESLAARRDAYAAHLAAGDEARAAMSCWHVFYEHFHVGEVAVAGGWLERARHHVEGRLDTAVGGFVALAGAEWALAHDDPVAAAEHAERALEAGRATGDPDLTAMALTMRGRLLVAAGRTPEGMASLDEAMVCVVHDQTAPLFTGWVYCLMLGVCHDVADVRRAAEWSDAAMRWCDELNEGLLYPGLCRVYRVELQRLRGAWETAEAEGRRACDEVVRHDRRYAGEAFYVVGDIRRLIGDLRGAEAAFRQAQELGRLPQPGLALVRLAQGKPEAAVNALRLALQSGPAAPSPRAQLLAALVEAEIAAGQPDAARASAGELTALAGASGSAVLDATARAALGTVLLAEDDALGAVARLREAWTAFQELGMPYEAARAQVAVGEAAWRLGDEDTATLELETALSAFRRLGATGAADKVAALLAATSLGSSRLSDREVEVLRLVSRGKTNREVGAALFISEHTVARHLSNIFTKLGVSSRAAATAHAYEHGLV